MLPDGSDNIIITGGNPLLSQIENELQASDLPKHSEYRECFDVFRKLFQPMNFYNVFFEGTNREKFRFVNGSTDVHTAKSNMQIDGRRINWYWSDTDHYTLKSQAKGPQLVLAKY